jgi:hypothetical protein
MTSDSDINTVCMYYYDVFLLPWLLWEICIFSFSIPSCFFTPKNKKCFLCFSFSLRHGWECSDVRNVEWQMQKSWLSHPRNMYIIWPKHQILQENWSLLSNKKKNRLRHRTPNKYLRNWLTTPPGTLFCTLPDEPIPKRIYGYQWTA